MTQQKFAEKLWLNSVNSDITFAISGYFCIFMRFLVLIQASMVIMVRYSENLLCFVICDINVFKEFYGWGEWLLIYIYISIRFFIHKIEKFIRIQPILKSNTTSSTFKCFFLASILKKFLGGQGALGSGHPYFSAL